MDKKKSILLHSCCGPCSTTGINDLKDEYNITICYYNPNIYPEEEYIKRKNTQMQLIAELNKEGYNINVLDVDYDPNRYEELVKDLHNEKEGGARCAVCFLMRLEKVAVIAKENGFDCFATTLTVSPHKNSQVINNIGNDVGRKYQIEYLPTDFKKKDGFKRSIQMSRKYELYRQNYCGCKYSIWF